MKVSKDFKLEKVSVRLVNDGYYISDVEINNPTVAVELMGDYLKEMDREVLMVLNLTAKLKPINCSVVSIGTLTQSLASPREMLKTAVLSNAAHIMIIHNHTSGKVHPSKSDVALTDRMVQICGLIDIPLLDHIIVAPGTDDYFSFSEKEIMSKPHINYKTDYNDIHFDRQVAEEMEEPERSR